jgi:hypothetical protein
MTGRQTTFDALVAGLRGRAPDDPDWTAVIELANHTLVTPALFAALREGGQIDRVPADVRDYLAFIHDRNRERNRRLRAQLFEAVAAFNRNGIVPILLKGAVPLFLSEAKNVPDRMTSDLDVAVGGAELAAATSCLEAIGYLPVDDIRGLSRPQDVGQLELRAMREDARPEDFGIAERAGARALLPTPMALARHWFMHDLVKEGDYVRGRIDLRHLLDLACLSAEGGVDWAAMRAGLPDRLSRNALDVQLLALHDLFGADVPAEFVGRPSTRFHHWRRTFTVRRRLAGAPLRVLGNLVWSLRRASRIGAMARHGPVGASRRAVQAVFQLRPRSKL